MLVSTKLVEKRFRDAVASVIAPRGNVYFIAPEAGYVAGRRVTPSANHDGLTPFNPIIIDEFWEKVVSGRGDVGVLQAPGDYQLTANINTVKEDYTVMAAPGLNRREVSVYGIDGGHALDLKGRKTRLFGFEVGGASDAHAACVLRGRFSQAKGMHFTSKDVDTERTLYGLLLALAALADTPSGGDASFIEVDNCLFSYAATCLGFSHEGVSNYNEITESKIRHNEFWKWTTRAIGPATTDVAKNGILVKENFFGPLGAATEFIKMNHAADGAVTPNALVRNTFCHANLTSTQIVVTAVDTNTRWVDNRSENTTLPDDI